MNGHTNATQAETVYLGSGCFWCTEAVFDDTDGVVLAESGYMGGQTQSPTYEQVCTGKTGHAEVVKVEYDPKKISFEQILNLFFATHDPTQLNRQGNDIGTQYRSAVFYTNTEQKEMAKEYIAAYQKQGLPVVTEVTAASDYYPAETYHQKYFKKNPNQGYCQIMIPPKLLKKQKVMNQSL